LVGKSERKIPFGRFRHGWEVNVGMDVKEIGRKVIDWIHLA
jgi:hypothetical protein